jgi:hypothetical protein
LTLITLVLIIVYLLFGNVIKTEYLRHSVYQAEGDTIGYSMVECESAVGKLLQSDNWYEQLLDPVLHSEQEIAEKFVQYSRIHTCLDEVIERNTTDLERIYLLAEYFLIFAGGYQTAEDGSELHLVDLSVSDDPAVVKIRDEAGLPPPPGYVFMRLYDSRESMPPRLQAIFSDRMVAGVTIFSRYIAVPTEAGGSVQDQILQQRTLPQTVSHELIHAYVHSSIHPSELGTLPEWFNEGVAIYFSGSGEDHVLVTPNVVAARTSTQEYLEYKEIFDYLEYRQGEERLQEMIAAAVSQLEPSLVYLELGIDNEEELISLTKQWRGQRIRQGQILGLVSVVLLAAFVVWLVPSEARCSCGYAGSRKKFIEDRCPRCMQPLESRKGSIRRRLRKIWKTCDVCARRFWFGNIDQVDELARETTLWIDQKGGVPIDQPQQERVRLICQDCRLTAARLEEQHHKQMHERMEEARLEAAKIYSRWLSQAQHVTHWFEDGLEMYSFDEALEHFVQAAIYPKYKLWVEQKSQFFFREFYGRNAENFNEQPPSGYENVLVKRVKLGAGNTRLYGSVRRFDGNRIGIYWVPGRE